MTEEQGEVIADLYRKEVSLRQIGIKIGVSVTTIRTWVRANRERYQLPRRRNLAEKQGANSKSIEIDCKWNLRLCKKYLSMRWGSAT